MKQCSNCGKEFSMDSKYCDICSIKLSTKKLPKEKKQRLFLGIIALILGLLSTGGSLLGMLNFITIGLTVVFGVLALIFEKKSKWNSIVGMLFAIFSIFLTLVVGSL